MTPSTSSRGPLLAAAVLALLAGLWGGVVRLGIGAPSLLGHLPPVHGPLMVCGFLGTVIGLERAVGLNMWWAYSAPILTGLGTLSLLILGRADVPGAVAMAAGGLVLVGDFIVIIRRHLSLATVTMALGAVAWLGGNILWASGWSIPHVVPWWMGFLVLTIAGERLELSRIYRTTTVKRAAFISGVSIILVGLYWTGMEFVTAVRLTGLGMAVLALWLMTFDVAWRTVRNQGLTRFIAVCLLSGEIWLGVGGVLGMSFGGAAAGPYYDAMLHAVFVGFVLSMIFGHAPLIIPAIHGVSIRFSPIFYSHLVLLHASLAMRLAGDLAGWPDGARWGGIVNEVAILLFFVNTIRAAAAPAQKNQP